METFTNTSDLFFFTCLSYQFDLIVVLNFGFNDDCLADRKLLRILKISEFYVVKGVNHL